MSDDKPKPFAEVVALPTGHGFDEYEIHLDGSQLMEHSPRWPTRSLPDEIVPAINAAVEAREAWMRGALRDVANLLGPAAEAPPDQFYEFNPMALRRVLERVAEVLSGVGPDYVPGDVACGLAFDLGAAQAKVEGTWGVLLDEMQESGGKALTVAAVQLAGRLGVPLGGSREGWLPLVTDDELRAECRRRGMVMEQRYDPPLRMPATIARDPQDDMACRSCVGRNGHHEVGCPRVRGVAPARTSP